MPDRSAARSIGACAVIAACLAVAIGCDSRIEPTAAPSPTVSPTHAPTVGWEITSENIGLRAVGLSCDALPSYLGPIDVPAGTTISERLIAEPLNLSAGNITIERSCIRPTFANRGLPIIATTNYNNQRPAGGPVTVRDSDFDGSMLSQREAGETTAFLGIGTLTNNYIHGFGSGIALMNTGFSLNALIELNYVTGLVAWGDAETSGTHSDAFTVRDFDASQKPERRASVSNNRFDCDSGSDTGALFVQTFAGRIDNLTVTGNLLEGGGYQLGLNQANFPYSDVTAQNNRFSATGYGPAYVQNGPGWTVWEENYVYDSSAEHARGALVAAP